MPDTAQLSLVVPCFNEQEALPHLLEALLPVLEREVGACWEVILVDDGSSDRTFEMIVQANLKDARVKGVSLSRNFGHQPAVACGLAFASGERANGNARTTGAMVQALSAPSRPPLWP